MCRTQPSSRAILTKCEPSQRWRSPSTSPELTLFVVAQQSSGHCQRLGRTRSSLRLRRSKKSTWSRLVKANRSNLTVSEDGKRSSTPVVHRHAALLSYGPSTRLSACPSFRPMNQTTITIVSTLVSSKDYAPGASLPVVVVAHMLQGLRAWACRHCPPSHRPMVLRIANQTPDPTSRP